VSNDGEIMAELNKLIVVHGEGHMCDACINARKRKEIMDRHLDEARAAYERRRGGAIGAISVREALARTRQPQKGEK
jgi:hypothetical protein